MPQGLYWVHKVACNDCDKEFTIKADVKELPKEARDTFICGECLQLKFLDGDVELVDGRYH